MLKTILVLLTVGVCVTACGGSGDNAAASSPPDSATLPPVSASNTPAVPDTPSLLILPAITDIRMISQQPEKFGLVELQVNMDARFNNPFDLREINLLADFTGPNGEQMQIPGFWDARSRWLVRFSPPTAGQWTYAVSVQDINGTSAQVAGSVNVNDSDNRGILRPGIQVNPNYSERYLAYQDGTPFYGIGHGDAFGLSFNTNITRELDELVTNMQAARENYIVYWPYFFFSPVENSFDAYSFENLRVMDTMVERFDKEGLHIVYTLWNHDALRGDTHPWNIPGEWFRTNGFNQLTSVFDFFTDSEAWEWQKNLYRYTIARWGYSSAIAMWQTVSEADGTNVGNNLKRWFAEVNDFFVVNDPYQHPTTASLSGDKTWAFGHQVMDIPQVHIYEDIALERGNEIGAVTQTASVIADYTNDMWQANAKPNWVGEYGVKNGPRRSSDYPELFHNATWAGLASGAAMTPAEWNDFFDWGVMTDEMKTHMRHFATFMEGVPLAAWNPTRLSIESDPAVFKAWGLTSQSGSIIWGLDTTLANAEIDEIRARRRQQDNITINIIGLAQGRYRVEPYNTWTGQFMPSITLFCQQENSSCTLTLPPFTSDIALRLIPIDA